MARHLFVVHTNPVAGREREFNLWYAGHLRDVLQVHGVVSAKRYGLSSAQVRSEKQPFGYLTLYEVDTGDPQSFVTDLLARVQAGAVSAGAALAPGSSAVLWEVLE